MTAQGHGAQGWGARFRSFNGLRSPCAKSFRSFAEFLVERPLTAFCHPAQRRGPFSLMPLPARKFCLIPIAPRVTHFFEGTNCVCCSVPFPCNQKAVLRSARAHVCHCAWRSIWATASTEKHPAAQWCVRGPASADSPSPTQTERRSRSSRSRAREERGHSWLGIHEAFVLGI